MLSKYAAMYNTRNWKPVCFALTEMYRNKNVILKIYLDVYKILGEVRLFEILLQICD